jgi:endonuclease/exonuclease/phosphatase family metal-dependent hydrolase
MIRFLTSFFFLVSLALFFSVYISPEYFPYVGLATLTIPLLLVINGFLFVALVFAKRKLAFLPLIALVIGWKFVGVTIQIRTEPELKEGLSVLSYNVHMFSYQKSEKGNADVSKNLIQWLQDNPSDIKCFQEFYQDPTTPSRNTIRLLGKEAGYHHYYQVIQGNPKSSTFGMAIFSKYPIVNEGIVLDSRSTNGIIFADIKVEKDTIRIYNAHLESMNIPSAELNDLEGIKENYKQTLRKLKRGQVTRATQLEILMEHMDNSPYANILVGDFNDVPYSYTYFTLRNLMNNGFEKAGNGFGFTYNKVLFFLRIDNIFFDDVLDILHFKTHSEVDYSDHYPVSAIFSLDKPIKKIKTAVEE